MPDPCSRRGFGQTYCPGGFKFFVRRRHVRRQLLMSVKATHPDERRAKKKGRVMWGFLYLFAFLAAFGGSAVWKLKHDPFGGEFQVS